MALFVGVAGNVIADGGVAGADSNPVVAENARPGTTDWIGAKAVPGLIEGYTDRVSALPGETVSLKVSTNPVASYRIEVYRLGWYGGAGARLVSCLPGCAASSAGITQSVPAPDPVSGEIRANWVTTDSFVVGDDWVSGYYLAVLRLTSGSSNGKLFYSPFVVRPPADRAKSILVQSGVTTWQAYNAWGGKSLYDFNSTGGAARKVSFDRPFGTYGTGPMDHELQLVRFLEREGYDVTYQTDIDTHREPGSLQGYPLVVTAGHDEYWSKAMRDAFESAAGGGTNLFFAGANTAYWQVRFENDERTMVGYKSSALDPEANGALETVQFRQLVPQRPECQLLGIQYQGGTISDSAFRTYTVRDGSLQDPWFTGTGFSPGATWPLAVGYEWDAIQEGCAVPGEQTVFFEYNGGSSQETAHAVRTVTPSGTRIFATGTMNWSWALDDFVQPGGGATGHVVDPRVQQFTRNALADLLQAAPTNAPPVATFSFAPLAPVLGQAVALTDLSLDAGGSIASRAWDLDDDGQYDDGTGATATLTPGTSGSYVVKLRVTDDQGASATAQAAFIVQPPGIPAGNLTVNPSFEAGTSGWGAWQASVTRVPDPLAPHGASVARVTRSTGSSFTVDDGPSTVSSTLGGRTYTASAYVRAASATSVGKPASVRVREIDGSGTVVAEASSTEVALTASFQRVQVSAVATAGGHQLDMRVRQGGAGSGDAMDVDVLTMVVDTLGNAAPSASFGLDPASPVVGESVVFTDTSSDPDAGDSIASRAWDLDGDGQYDDGTGATASASFTSSGQVTVGLQVTDTHGASSTASMTITVGIGPVIPTGSRTTNPSFEVTTNGWRPWQATLTRVVAPDAPDGAAYVRVTRSTGTSFTIDDVPNTVMLGSVAGRTYTASAWVRAASPSSVGKRVTVRVREFNPSGAVVRETISANVFLTTSFQFVSVVAAASASGNTIDVRISHAAAATGDAFDADAIALVPGP